MAIEFQADFDGYLDTVTGNAVKAKYYNVDALWDDFPLIDSLGFIDDGLSVPLDIIFDQEYYNIGGMSVGVQGFQPVAYVKYKDAPSMSHNDKFLIYEITTRQGNTLSPETNYLVKGIENNNEGMVKVILEEI